MVVARGAGISAGHSVVPKQGVCCVREGPQPEVFRPLPLLGEHVVTLFAFKGQSQGVPVELSSCVSPAFISLYPIVTKKPCAIWDTRDDG